MNQNRFLCFRWTPQSSEELGVVRALLHVTLDARKLCQNCDCQLPRTGQVWIGSRLSTNSVCVCAHACVLTFSFLRYKPGPGESVSPERRTETWNCPRKWGRCWSSVLGNQTALAMSQAMQLCCISWHRQDKFWSALAYPKARCQTSTWLPCKTVLNTWYELQSN